MLHYQGFSIGAEILDQYMKIAKSRTVEDLVEVARAINMTLGWGVIEDVSVDSEKGGVQNCESAIVLNVS